MVSSFLCLVSYLILYLILILISGFENIVITIQQQHCEGPDSRVSQHWTAREQIHNCHLYVSFSKLLLLSCIINRFNLLVSR